MKKTPKIKFGGFRTWKEKGLMIKFRIEKIPAEDRPGVIEEIKKSEGVFVPSHESWYVPAKNYTKLRRRILSKSKTRK